MKALLIIANIVTLLALLTKEVVGLFDDELYFGESMDVSGTWPANGDLRLVGGDGYTHSAGRLEVFLEEEDDGSGLQPLGQWGTVCGSKYSKREANVACRQLGYQSAVQWNLTKNTQFTPANSSTPIHLSGVRCKSSKYKWHMLRCRHNDIGTPTGCDHDMDVAIYCSSDRIWDKPYKGQVRLVNDNGITSSFGKVEVYQGRQWGTVCGKNFGEAAADSVCRQLGYTNAAAISGAPSNGSQVIWVEKIKCNKSRSCFTSCFKAHKPTHQCTHEMDVAVQCVYDFNAKGMRSGSKSKCKIRGFPIILLILIVTMGLSIILVGGVSIISCLLLAFCCRKRYRGRHYEELS